MNLIFFAKENKFFLHSFATSLQERLKKDIFAFLITILILIYTFCADINQKVLIFTAGLEHVCAHKSQNGFFDSSSFQ